jgi:hypothetical protein
MWRGGFRVSPGAQASSTSELSTAMPRRSGSRPQRAWQDLLVARRRAQSGRGGGLLTPVSFEPCARERGRASLGVGRAFVPGIWFER